MTFLLPLAGLLGLLSLPIIAFYLLRTRPRTRTVSTLIFWEQLRPKVENSPLWRRLRRWISLLLQLVILALLVAAIARPAFDWETQAPSHLVAVIDNSASMGATSGNSTRWKRAVEKLNGAIDRLRVSDSMALLTTEDPPRLLSGWTSRKRELREALRDVHLALTGSDPSHALAVATELAGTRDRAEIVVLSDTVWPEPLADLNPETTRIPGPAEAVAPNVGITLFAVRRSPFSPGDWQLDLELVASRADRFTANLAINRNGIPMDSVPIDIEPGGRWARSWTGSSADGATFEAELRASDALEADNKAKAELKALRPVRILVAGPEDPFLMAALESIPLVVTSHARSLPGNPENFDLIIAQGALMPSELSGNAWLLIDPAMDGFWGKKRGVTDNAVITEVAGSLSPMRHTGFSALSIDKATAWEPAPGAQILASSGDSPIVFGSWDRHRRWIVLGFDPEHSDLPLRTAFPIFIANLVQSLRNDHAAPNASAVLPGLVETELVPTADTQATASGPGSAGSLLPVLPGWWIALLAGMLLLLAECFLYSRRITD